MTSTVMNKPNATQSHAPAHAPANAKAKRSEAGASPADAAGSGFLAIMASLEALEVPAEGDPSGETLLAMNIPIEEPGTARDDVTLKSTTVQDSAPPASSDSVKDAAAMWSTFNLGAMRQVAAPTVREGAEGHGVQSKQGDVSTLELARQQAAAQKGVPEDMALAQATDKTSVSELPLTESRVLQGSTELVDPLAAARAPSPPPARRPEGAEVALKSQTAKEALFEPLVPLARKAAKAQSDTAAKQAVPGTDVLHRTDTERMTEVRKVAPDPSWLASARAAMAPEDAATFASSLVRFDEAPRMRSIFRRDTTEGNPGVQATSVGSTTPAGEAVPVQAPTTEMVVAEQVAFWITRDVKNAEMQLDGLGAEPVQVSISMSGNEAQVVFRTDELQTRELLENASLHLKELLQKEGLVLSGMSVGTNGSGESGKQESRPRQGTKHTAVIGPQIPQPSAQRSLGTGAGGTLDLFV